MPGKSAARPRPSSWALALLFLLASLAFATRDAGMAPIPGMDMSDMNMAGMNVGAGHEHRAPAAGQHDHAGHCPFCFTAAFALEAVDVSAPLGTFSADALHAPPERRSPFVAAARHPDARAPPHFPVS